MTSGFHHLRERVYLLWGLSLVPLLVFDFADGAVPADALLTTDSHAHWWFALGSALAAVVMIAGMFRGGFGVICSLVLRGIFVGTLGIALLLGFQWLADYSLTLDRFTGTDKEYFYFWIVRFIGFAYRCTSDPSAGPILTFVGYTAAVGFGEELCKALPVLYDLDEEGNRRIADLEWRGILMIGMACGTGFGVAESVHYSVHFYNGSASAPIYWVRFVSLVGLHAMWAGCGALLLEAADNLSRLWWLRALALPILAHASYNTHLAVGENEMAKGAAVASFVLFVLLVERARWKNR